MDDVLFWLLALDGAEAHSVEVSVKVLAHKARTPSISICPNILSKSPI